MRGPGTIRYTGGFDAACEDHLGRVLWRERAHNMLLNQGQYDILDCWFRNNCDPSASYIGLLTTSQVAIPARTANLATLVTYELVAASYSRQQLNRDTTDWPTIALDSGSYRCTSKSVLWTATATWSPLRWLFLCSVPSGTSGRAWSVAQLLQDRTVPNGGSLTVSYWSKLS